MHVRIAEAFCVFVDFRRLGVGPIDVEGNAVAEGVHVLAQAAVDHDNILSPRIMKKIRGLAIAVEWSKEKKAYDILSLGLR